MAALERMPPDLRAQRDEARRAAKANGVAKQEAAMQRRRTAVEMTLAGFSGPEIAEMSGENMNATRSRLQRLGISISKAGMRRLPTGWLKTGTRDALDALAAERGVEPFEIVSKLLDVAFEDGATKARSLLRHSFLRAVERSAA